VRRAAWIPETIAEQDTHHDPGQRSREGCSQNGSHGTESGVPNVDGV